MTIKELELSCWRKINQLKLELTGGINILFGKNEIGKSTIIEAIRFAFFEKSESDSREVKKVVSWNTNVKSNVALTFSVKDGNVYRINKSFPKGNAELYLLKNKIKKKISEGKNVNEDILAILGINDKVINLFDLLWISQGRTLSLFEKNSELENKMLQTEIKSIIKNNIVSKKTEDLYKIICDNYESYYSSKTNKFRVDIIKLNETYDEKARILDSINSQINSVTEKTDEMNKILNRTEKTESNIKRLKAQIEKLESLKTEIEKTEKLKIKYDFIKKDYEKLLSIKEDNTALEKEIPGLLKELKAYLTYQEGLIAAGINEYNELKKQEAEIDKKLIDFKIKDQRMIDEIISLKNKIEMINNQLSLNQLKVRIEPVKKISYRIKFSNTESDIDTEEKKEFFSDDKINIDIKDTACISISAPIPKDKISELKKTAEISVKRLNELYKTAQTDDLEKIRKEYEDFKNQSSEKDKIKMKMLKFDIKKMNETLNNLRKEIDIINQDDSEVKINKDQDIDSRIQNLKNEIFKKQNRLNNACQQSAEILKNSTFDDFRINYLKLKDEIDLQEKKTDESEIKNSNISALLNSAKKELDDENGEMLNLTRIKTDLEAKSNLSNDLLKNKAEIENELENIDAKRKNELSNFYSFRLLKELIENEKKTLDDKIIFPLQEKVSEEFKKLTSSNYENINLSKDLSFNTIDAKTIDGRKATINSADISLGTREQLSFIFRFIIAQYLSANENSVMILDDSFVNTDLKRFEYILEKIKAYQDKIQFLIFTCRENDYKNILKNVNFIDLEKLIF